jgi:hypothetical protein
MTSFLEAFAFHGRNSMAVAATMQVDESVAYNLIARHLGETEPAFQKPETKRSPYSPASNIKRRERLREIRLEERGVAR